MADLGGDRLVRSAQARAGAVRRDERMREAEQILRSRLNFQGTTMGFSTERTDYLWWLMVSGDVNANRVVLSMLDQEQLARGHAAAGARQLGTAAARALEHDRGQCVGCAGDAGSSRDSSRSKR